MGVAFGACAPESLHGVGRASDLPALTALTARGVTAATEPAPSPLPPDFLATFARIGADSFVSWGHAGGQYAAAVYVSASAKDGTLRRSELPAGAQLVMTTVDRATKKAGPTFFMEKLKENAASRGARWRYGVVTIEPGAERRTTEDFTLCARCHAEAPRDQVFGVPD